MCHDYWDALDAEVVCRQLGLPFSNAQPVGAAVFGQGFGRIWLDDVACFGFGFENSLDECLNYYYYHSWGVHNCYHSRDAGVVCRNGNYLN